MLCLRLRMSFFSRVGVVGGLLCVGRTPRTEGGKIARMPRVPRGLVALGAAAACLLLALPAPATTFKIATLSPAGSAWMNILRAAAEEVDAATEGRVAFRFYPGGAMGDDWAVLRKIRAGQLHGGVVTTTVFNRIYSDVQLYNLPLVFRDLSEVDAVRAQLDSVLLAGMERNGFVAFGIAEVGMAYAMSQRPTGTLESLRRAKVWSPEGDISVARALETFGIAPIPLTVVDVLPGLQTGLIDTVASPPVAAVALQWHTQLDYVLDIPLMYVYGLLAVSERRFRRLSDADATAVRQILGKAVADADRRNRSDHDATMQVLISQGLKLTSPATEELADWRRLGKRAETRWVSEGIISNGLYQQLQAALAAARGKVSGTTAPDSGSPATASRQ